APATPFVAPATPFVAPATPFVAPATPFVAPARLPVLPAAPDVVPAAPRPAAPRPSVPAPPNIFTGVLFAGSSPAHAVKPASKRGTTTVEVKRGVFIDSMAPRGFQTAISTVE